MLFIEALDFQKLFFLYVHVLLLSGLLAVAVILWSTDIKHQSENVAFFFGKADYLISNITKPCFKKKCIFMMDKETSLP